MEPDNLRLAWLKAIKGKRDKDVVLKYREDLDANLEQLAFSLYSGEKVWGPYYSFTIYDPKERIIKVAPLEDRIAHHAIMNICEPIFDSFQIQDSYACRKNKGQHLALFRAVEFSQQYEWYLKCDVRKYFDRVSHSILLELLERRFKDRTLLETFTNLVESYHFQPGQGIPIGNLTSQFFANHYLGQLDKYIKRALGIQAYIRYMDDFVVWGRHEELRNVHKLIEEFCREKLSLELKPVQLNRTSMGVPFLGMRVYPCSIRLSHRARCRFREKVQKNVSELGLGVLSVSEFGAKMNSLIAFIRFAKSLSFRLRVFRDNGICP